MGPDPASEKLRGRSSLPRKPPLEERAVLWCEWFLPGATTLTRVLPKYQAAPLQNYLYNFYWEFPRVLGRIQRQRERVKERIRETGNREVGKESHTGMNMSAERDQHRKGQT